jgi:hypothetical protein
VKRFVLFISIFLFSCSGTQSQTIIYIPYEKEDVFIKKGHWIFNGHYEWVPTKIVKK